MTTEIVYDPLSEAIGAISKINLSPEDGLRFINIISAMYGVAVPTPTAEPKSKENKKRTATKNIWNVAFGSHLNDLVKDSPKLPADLIEPLRERGVRLAKDNEIASKQILTGFRKSKNVYREHAEEKWGLISYSPARLVVGKE
jgi:hypothetical protein